MKRVIPLVVWLALGAGLAVLTTRVADWLVMTGRAALRAARAQRHPSALSAAACPSRAGGDVRPGVSVADRAVPRPWRDRPGSLRRPYCKRVHDDGGCAAGVRAHGAYDARRLGRRHRGGTHGSRAMDGARIVPADDRGAYPSFAWALLAFHVAVTSPSQRNDTLAGWRSWWRSARARMVHRARSRPLRCWCTAGRGGIRAPRAVRRRGRSRGWFAATGHNPLGTYGSTTAATRSARCRAVVLLAPGGGRCRARAVPFVVGGVWLPRRDPFAILALPRRRRSRSRWPRVQRPVRRWPLRDRYIFYLAPVFASRSRPASPHGSELVEAPRPRRCAGVGFAAAPLPVFDKLNVDTPVSIIDGYLRRELGGPRARASFSSRRRSSPSPWSSKRACCSDGVPPFPLAALALLLTTAETGYAVERLFRVDGRRDAR